MSGDRELLEAAAKAAGYKLECRHMGAGRYAFAIVGTASWLEWNPLTDDGDAFRLGVKLGLFSDVPVWGTTDYAEFRRAIVKAAAAIGASTERAAT